MEIKIILIKKFSKREKKNWGTVDIFCVVAAIFVSMTFWGSV